MKGIRTTAEKTFRRHAALYQSGVQDLMIPSLTGQADTGFRHEGS